MSLNDTIMADMKAAMKSRDKVKLSTVRMIKSALMNEKIKKGRALKHDEELTVLNREKKQREESIAEYSKAGRQDLVNETKAELKIVENYLPQQMSQDELTQAIEQVIKDTGAKSKADFGKVMKNLMPKIKGRADGKTAATLVRGKLQ